MRNAYEPPPWLAPLNTPAVLTTAGLGTGGGAAVQTADSGGFGDINVYIGPGYTANGNVGIQFPNAPPTLFISANEAFGHITQTTVGDEVIIAWTAASFSSPGSSKPYRIHYEWAVST